MEKIKVRFSEMLQLISEVEYYSQGYQDIINSFESLMDEINTSGMWKGSDKDAFIERMYDGYLPFLSEVKMGIDEYKSAIKKRHDDYRKAEEDLSSRRG